MAEIPSIELCHTAFRNPQALNILGVGSNRPWTRHYLCRFNWLPVCGNELIGTMVSAQSNWSPQPEEWAKKGGRTPKLYFRSRFPMEHHKDYGAILRGVPFSRSFHQLDLTQATKDYACRTDTQET